MTVSGNEPRFRELFAEQAGPELDRIATDLLALESNADDPDPELVNSLFRDAHNLKGGAAMVGLEEIRVLAHAMEDLLEPLRAGTAVPTPLVVDQLLAAVDAIRQLVPALVRGEPHQVDVAGMAAALRAAIPSAPPAPAREPPAAPEPASTPTAPDPASTPAAPQPAAGDGRPHQDRAGAATIGSGRTGDPAATVQVPLLHLNEIVRLAGEGGAAQLRLGQQLAERLDLDPTGLTEFRELSMVLSDLQRRATRSRMVPVAAVVEVLQRAARDLARGQGKQVRWTAVGTGTELDRSVLEMLVDPLRHLVRNAVDHGIEPPAERVAAGKPAQGEIRLHVRQAGPDVIITIRDDGRGVDVARVRAKAGVAPGASTDGAALQLIFRTGLSTAEEVTDVSGRGVGLDVVRTNVEAVRGRIEVNSRPGAFTEFTISVPVTLTVQRCLLVSSSGQRYAIPLHNVVTVLPPTEPELISEGRPVIWQGDHAVRVSGLAEALDPAAPVDSGPVVVLAGVAWQHGFRIGELLGQRDMVVRGLSRLLPRIDCYIGVSAEADGSVVPVIDASGLIEQARKRGRAWSLAGSGPVAVAALPAAAPAPAAGAGSNGAAAPTILVVEDALTVRELQRSILERAGYRVLTAADGLAALAVAESRPVDLVLTDVSMPRMDGLELARTLRSHPRLSGVGIIMVTSLGGDEDRRQGLEAGADGYLTKDQFDEQILVDTVQRILGEPA
jgi:two-component system chemotaxis sensor kinase CheA